VKRRRLVGIFLLAVSFLIPWNVAYLYYDYYTEADFLVRKHLSAEEDEGLLSLFKENSRVLIQPGQNLQQHVIPFFQVIFFQPDSLLSVAPKHPVLRC
jgi:hypothetical protein